jgi:predicted amidohydrolase
MPPFRVAFVQAAPRFGRVTENLERGLALAATVEADLVVLPELWSSGYVFSSHAEVAALAEDAALGPTARALAAAARRERRHFVAGFPEAARTLALMGADVIAHPSNLVFPNAQAAMLTRSIENRIYTVTANRTGVETRPGGRVAFTGRSQIVDPGGAIVARAGVREACARAAAADLALSRDKSLTARTHLFRSRRPRFYRRLTAVQG